MKKHTLVVVDMQSYFPAANSKKTIAKCKDLILQAGKSQSPIIFVEYFECGNTIKSLTKMADSHGDVFFVRKDKDDGSKLVKGIIKGCKLPMNIKVCGVNTDQCVLETIRGLSKTKGIKIEVVAEACNSDNHFYGLEKIKLMKNVKISKGV